MAALLMSLSLRAFRAQSLCWGVQGLGFDAEGGLGCTCPRFVRGGKEKERGQRKKSQRERWVEGGREGGREGGGWEGTGRARTRERETNVKPRVPRPFGESSDAPPLSSAASSPSQCPPSPPPLLASGPGEGAAAAVAGGLGALAELGLEAGLEPGLDRAPALPPSLKGAVLTMIRLRGEWQRSTGMASGVACLRWLPTVEDFWAGAQSCMESHVSFPHGEWAQGNAMG